jgi:hypothetical protein
MVAKAIGSGGFAEFDPPAWPILLISKTNNLGSWKIDEKFPRKKGKHLHETWGANFLRLQRGSLPM